MRRKLTGGRLLMATHNSGKLDEIRDLLSHKEIAITSAGEHGLPEPEETGTTFVENARLKAHFAATSTGLPALSDDSGLEISALDGAPGVYTADWAETPDGRDFDLAMRRAYDMLCRSDVPEPWVARFCCTLALAWPDGHDEIFFGTVEGRIVWPKRGETGHGYDPIFVPDGYDRTFGELDRAVKNEISHRARAMSAFLAETF